MTSPVLPISLLAYMPLGYWLWRAIVDRMHAMRIDQRSARIYVTLVCSLPYLLLLILLMRWTYSLDAFMSVYPAIVRIYLVSLAIGWLYLRYTGPSIGFHRLMLDSAAPVLLFFAVYLAVTALVPLSRSEVATLLPIALAVHYFNTGAMVFSHHMPLDFGMVLPDGFRVLGDGVSLRGSIGGMVSGSLAGFVGSGFISILPPIGALSGLLGDSGASFMKRRLGLASGSQVIILDQLDATLPMLALGVFSDVIPFSARQLIVFILVGLLVAMLANLYAFLTGRKNVPW